MDADGSNVTQLTGGWAVDPAWSPDGVQVAYWSDRSGEYELVLRAADGSGRRTRRSDSE